MNRMMFFLALTALAGSCMAVEIPQSATELGCVNCHAADHKVVGPAWMDISRRFRDKRNDPAVLAQLVKNVSRGSEGNWGDVPMVATDPAGTRHDKIVELMKFVLSLSDRAPEARSK